MATHSSILAWRIPWTEEPGGLQSMGSLRVWHNWSDLAHMHVHRPGRRRWDEEYLSLLSTFGTRHAVLEMQRWVDEFHLCLKTSESQWKHFKQGEWIIVISFCSFLSAAGRMPPFQSSHPVDRQLSVIAPTCLLPFPFSLPLNKLAFFTYSHMKDTGNLFLTPSACIPPLAAATLVFPNCSLLILLLHLK